MRTINEHIQNIFDEQELDLGATIRKFRIVQTEGTRDVSRLVDHYNLDVYLTDDEIRTLNRIVTMYLDYAEEQAERRKPLHVSDWREKLDAFLQLNERDVLKDAGRVSAEGGRS